MRRGQQQSSRTVRPAAYAVIMAGGQGTRFWPRSRRRLPKHLLCVSGRRTLLQETAHRLLPLFPWRRMLVVTNKEQAAEVRRQLPRIPSNQVLEEPVGRNTLGCIALASEWIAARDADALMVALPADHVIKDAAELRRTIRVACALAARQRCLVTLGIAPNRPETGYGYIQIGLQIGTDGANAFWVRRFHEKPSAAAARRYVSSGGYLWNSGMFIWQVSAFRAALDRVAPQVSETLSGVWSSPRGVRQRLQRAYRALPSVSVDVGVLQPLSVMRKDAPRIAVLRAQFDWNDVGSWVSLPEVWGCDAEGNAALGRTLAVDASGSIVYAPERLVALIGTKDLIVVDSPDALLICARERAQDVRRITDLLKQRRWSRYL